MAEYGQQRKAPRIRVASRPWGRIPGALEYRLVDLSIAGARIEHQVPLDPGSTWGVELPLPFGPMSLQARVVHSGPVGDTQVRDADALLRYQSGLAFLGMTLEQQATLRRRLNILYPRAENSGLETAREGS
jgi:hypothetical protein